MIGIEALDEQDLREVADFYVRLSERAKASGTRKELHSFGYSLAFARCGIRSRLPPFALLLDRM